ncbi:MAG: trehalose-phosphatase [Acidimicrobiaceae bacterium]|nr:trehalose-phosphatase [Acidimicrobiaceae bacterium]
MELLSAAPAASCLLTDFDGTLSEIVEDPTGAVALDGVPELLADLSGRLGCVAVISGRPVAFLAAALTEGRAPSTLGLYGIYGVEAVGAPGGEGDETRAWRALVATARGEVPVLPAGAELEDKGLTFALHWRNAPDSGPELEALAQGLAARHGLVAHHGKMAIELMPRFGRDKGSVVRELAAGRQAACFLGDDLGDLAAFRALAELSSTGTATVRVAVAGPEAPRELLAEADVVLDGPRAARALLEELARALP